MQVRVDQFKNGGVPCGCGRSLTGFCDGSHGLSESAWLERKALLETDTVKDIDNTHNVSNQGG